MAASEIADRNSPARDRSHDRPHDRRPKRRHRLLRPVFDALGAALVFVMLTAVGASAPVKACAFSGAFSAMERPLAPHAIKAIAESGPAPIIEIATTSSAHSPDAVFRRTSSTAAWGLWGLSLSLLAALNLSFFRHLRRVYINPRGHRAASRQRYPQDAASEAIELPHSRL